ncbi:hypothetical protein DSD19_04725 [Rhodovulum sp. BSW8]|uniref:DUF2303 family protein n=1 Tax=Rhodovulum sp. BSW8 TaxID=2259645 RepID=UPI000DE56479|nr:DUF2303 family protein [Rhodovulum sp. BSW8]RBO54684.1 hypothetical protein DSD19_04725 [Rhodovulum sp. BSW8]
MVETITKEAANIAQTMRETMEDLCNVQDITRPTDANPLRDPVIVSVPTGQSLHYLTDAHRAALEYIKPTRRRGIATHMTLESLIGWANRFKGETSVLYVNPDPQRPSLTCIADYHAAGAADVGALGDPSARHCAHQGVYRFPLSKEWKFWTAISGKGLDKDELGELIEEHAKDVLDPTPSLMNPGTVEPSEPWEERMLDIAQRIQGRFAQLSRLLDLSKSFQIYETSNLEVRTNRDTGEQSVQFVNEHKDVDGKPIALPNLFMLAIPVFESGALYRVPVRFRYRKSGATVKFILSLYDPESAFDDALDEAVNTAMEATDLPLFAGTPEAA